MDIHRCRFVPYPASPINALAFSHETGAYRGLPRNLRLAVGRANGDIELWDPRNGIWIQEVVFKGGKERSIEGLVWTHDLEDEGPSGETLAGKLRLFSIGYSNTVTEWNLNTGMPLRHSAGNHSEVWCLAAQPRWKPQDGISTRKNQLLAVGCADGSIVLQSTDDGGLSYLRNLLRPSNLKARILSLTFEGRDTLIAGCSDSTIWIYDIRGKGKVKHTMSLGAGPKGSSNNILVWSVRIVRNDVLVSGDSNGELRFWDLKTATLLQRIKCHEADVHDIAPGVDGVSLLSAGTDRRICRLQCNQESGRWHRVSHQRVHRGDVKAMAVLETKKISVVVSGGGDSAPTLTPLRCFGTEDHRSLPSFPLIPPVVSAPRERMLVSWWDREVSLCCMTADSLRDKGIEESLGRFEEGGVMDKILIKGEEAITSVSISSCGSQLLAVGTAVECKLFVARKNTPRNPPPGEMVKKTKIRKLDIPLSLARCGVRHLQFSPNGRWLLIVRPDSCLFLYRFVRRKDLKNRYEVLENPIELHRREHPTLGISRPLAGTMGDYQKCVSRIAWSSDSHIIVCADLSGNLDSWVLKEGEQSKSTKARANPGTDGVTNGASNGIQSDFDSSNDEESIAEDSRIVLGQSWSRLQPELPKLPTPPLILSFRPVALTPDDTSTGAHGLQAEQHVQDSRSQNAIDVTDKLVAVTSLHEIYEFEVLRGSLSDWSRRNPPTHFPTEFLKDKDRAMGCVWDISNGKQRLWVYSSTALWMFDMSRDFPSPEHSSEPQLEPPLTFQNPGSSTTKRRKRKRDDDQMSWQGSHIKNPELWRQKGQSSGAGDRILTSTARLSLGNNIRMTTTDDMERSKETKELGIDRGSLGGSDNDEDIQHTLDTNRNNEMSSVLAQYRREEAAKKTLDVGLTKSVRTNGGLQESTLTNGVRTRGINPGSQQDQEREKPHANGSGDKDYQDDGKEMPVADQELDRSGESPHFWRTYKYRPILGIVPLEKTEDDAIAGIEDDEVVPDLEVALVERPLWETDLDLPWDSHP